MKVIGTLIARLGDALGAVDRVSDLKHGIGADFLQSVK